MPSLKIPDNGWVWDGRFPHCDHRIVHKPGECEICDEYAPLLQYIRQIWGINFTGEHVIQNDHGTAMLPCPAEVARPYAVLNAWHGNSAKPKGYYENFAKEMEKISANFKLPKS